MKHSPVVEDHDSSGLEHELDSVVGVLELSTQDLQVAVELADLPSGNCLERCTVIEIKSDLQNISGNGIKFDDRRSVFVMATFFDVFSSHESLRQPIEHIRMRLFDLRGNLEAID